MAEGNSIAASIMADKKDPSDHYEVITYNLAVATAILDAAKVLTALHSARADAKEGSGATGEGYANGFTLRDDTLPIVLDHAIDLLGNVGTEADVINDTMLVRARVAIAR